MVTWDTRTAMPQQLLLSANGWICLQIGYTKQANDLHPEQDGQDWTRAYSAPQNVQFLFKTFELFVSGKFVLIFLEQG